MLPSLFKTLSGFASLNKDWLAPHDTINAVVQSADGSHGIVELTFAAPTTSRSERAFNGITITGTDGWLSVNQVKVIDGSRPVGGLRVTVVTAKRDKDGKDIGETEEIIDKETDGVPNELRYFIDAIGGSDNGLGTARGALQDVAFIQAGLTSNGTPINLEKLVS